MIIKKLLKLDLKAIVLIFCFKTYCNLEKTLHFQCITFGPNLIFDLFIEEMKIMEPERIAAPEVREKIIDESALLVCAYDDNNKFQQFHLDGAISLNEFKSEINGLKKDHEIFFYCA
jgi:hypothetical protein